MLKMLSDSHLKRTTKYTMANNIEPGETEKGKKMCGSFTHLLVRWSGKSLKGANCFIYGFFLRLTPVSSIVLAMLSAR